jgi:hypothetical protein
MCYTHGLSSMRSMSFKEINIVNSFIILSLIYPHSLPPFLKHQWMKKIGIMHI